MQYILILTHTEYGLSLKELIYSVLTDIVFISF